MRGATADDREAELAVRTLPNSGPTWLSIALRCAQSLGAARAEVLELRRTPHAVRARARCFAELLDAGYSYPEIARGWAMADHSAVLDAVQRHEPEAARRRTAEVARRREARRGGPGLVKVPALEQPAGAAAAAQG